MNKDQLLSDLANDFGFESTIDMLEAAVVDSVSPGICVTQGCGYTTEVEPDQRAGYCEACDTQTVKSALVLAGLI